MSDQPALAGMGAGALARLVAGGQVTAVEVLDAHLARIEERNPEINAVVALDEPTARSAATAVDQAVADRLPLPPLAGVPVTVKEAFAAIGMATTAGMAEHRGAPATADAPAVGRLRQAGALILGKTNVPTQLADLHCANPLFGRTANPWDLTRSPGGSSGGSAAALAAGMAALELGSDLSGSIRIPASWCGVVGLRPSNRVIPSGAICPGPSTACSSRPPPSSGPWPGRWRMSVWHMGRSRRRLRSWPAPRTVCGWACGWRPKGRRSIPRPPRQWPPPAAPSPRRGLTSS